MQEKRRHARIHFERQVQIDFFTEVYDDCQVKDISLGGMYVAGKFPQKLEDQCYINFVQTAKNTYLKLEALAEVMRKDKEGIGLQFLSMSFESLLSLEMILLFQAKEESPEARVTIPEQLPFEVCEGTSSFPNKYNPFLDESE